MTSVDPIHDFSVFEADCPRCGAQLEPSSDPSADGTSWRCRCGVFVERIGTTLLEVPVPAPPNPLG
jgi:hypothetical protein